MFRRLLKKLVILSDKLLGSNLYEKLLSIRAECWDSLSLILGSIDPFIVKWKYMIGVKGKTPLKLHLGCGGKHFDAYVSIDLRKTRATDLVCNMRKLPYPDSSVELIETYHVIEHLNRHDLPISLKEWHRVLVGGGRLIIECPDFDEAVKEYIEGNEERIDNIFGLQRFTGDVHQFGYNFKRLKKLLGETGFKNIEVKEPKDNHTKDEPCLRVECSKINKP